MKTTAIKISSFIVLCMQFIIALPTWSMDELPTETPEKPNLLALTSWALECLIKAEQLKNENPSKASDHYEKAAELYQKVMRHYSNLPAGIYRNTALAHFELENWDKAIEFYKVAIEKDAKPRDHARIAMAHLEKAKQEAIKNAEPQGIEEVIRQIYRNAAIHFDIYLKDPSAQDISAAYYLDAFKTHLYLGNAEKAYAYFVRSVKTDVEKTKENLRQLGVILPGSWYDSVKNKG